MIDWSQVPRACPKVVYESRQAALATAKYSQHIGQRAYACPDCGRWHLSSLRRPDRYRKTSDRRNRQGIDREERKSP